MTVILRLRDSRAANVSEMMLVGCTNVNGCAGRLVVYRARNASSLMRVSDVLTVVVDMGVVLVLLWWPVVARGAALDSQQLAQAHIPDLHGRDIMMQR